LAFVIVHNQGRFVNRKRRKKEEGRRRMEYWNDGEEVYKFVRSVEIVKDKNRKSVEIV
jgi:hypothetical protein